MFDAKRFVDTLVNTGLTPNEFLILYLIHMKDTATLWKYTNNVRIFSYDERDKLIDMGYLKDHNKFEENGHDRQTLPEGYEVTKKFIKKYFLVSGEAFDELWNKYPGYLTINGAKVPNKSADPDELAKVYGTKIGHSIDKHEEVMKLLEYAIENNLIHMNIKNWITSKQWEVVKEAKEESYSKYKEV